MEKSLAEDFLKRKFLNIDDLIYPEHIVENYLKDFDVVRELSTECTVVFKTELEKDDFLDQPEKTNFLSSKEFDRALGGVSATSSPSYIAKKKKRKPLR